MTGIERHSIRVPSDSGPIRQVGGAKCEADHPPHTGCPRRGPPFASPNDAAEYGMWTITQVFLADDDYIRVNRGYRRDIHARTILSTDGINPGCPNGDRATT